MQRPLNGIVSHALSPKRQRYAKASTRNAFNQRMSETNEGDNYSCAHFLDSGCGWFFNFRRAGACSNNSFPFSRSGGRYICLGFPRRRTTKAERFIEMPPSVVNHEVAWFQ